MARVQPAPAPSPRNGGSFQEASSFSSALNTTSSDPPFEHIQRHSSSSQEVSDSSFLTNSASQEALSFSSNCTDPPFDHIKCHSLQEVTADSFFLVNSALHSHVTQQEASGSSPSLNPNLSLNLLPVYSSREAPNPPSIINATSSDSSFDVLGSLGELPSKPNVPSELSMNFGFVLDLEIFNTRSQPLFDEQKKSLEFTKMYIDALVNQCISSLWTHCLLKVYQCQATTICRHRQDIPMSSMLVPSLSETYSIYIASVCR
ncbi:MAG: hypothetical protein NXY57DRAFT_1042031 [Lentinula lateritia]|nr:MAG: hypothetical protein NXY57DRAFT_1042031 [Lentinula lateritia]